MRVIDIKIIIQDTEQNVTLIIVPIKIQQIDIKHNNVT